MYWLGDSKWGWQFNFRRFPGEFIQGLIDNIPPCCVIYYTLVKVVCLLVHGPKRWRIKEEYDVEGPTKDAMIFSMFFDLQKQKSRTYHSEDFQKLDYWRCPLCRVIDKRNKLDWATGSRWDYKRFW